MVAYKNFLLKIFKHQLLSGSLVMVIGTNTYNFSQLIYHFLAGRFLGKAGYGDLAALISVLGLLGIIHGAFGLTIVKFIASEKNPSQISDFVKWIYRWNLVIGLVIGLSIILIAPVLSNFLNISNPGLIYLLGPILLIFFVTSAGRNVFQGLLKFDKYVYSLLFEAGGKVVFTIVLFFAGLAVAGALLGFFAGLLLSFIVTTFLLRHYIFGKINKNPDFRSFLKYSLAATAQGVSLTSMYTADLILVKHFFPADTAGLYAALAILGRIVFFGTTPITQVMFPLIAKRHLDGQKYLRILYLSIVLITLVSAAIIGFYYLFPAIPIEFLYGKSFLEQAGILWWFGVFMGILSIATLLTQFYLSVGKTKVVGFFIAAALLQIVLIWFIHTDILTVIKLSIFSATLLNVALFVYFVYLYYPRLK